MGYRVTCVDLILSFYFGTKRWEKYSALFFPKWLIFPNLFIEKYISLYSEMLYLSYT